MHSQSSFFDGTYDWQAMLECNEHFLSEAREKVLSWRVNLGEGKKKNKGEAEKKQLTLISSEAPFQYPHLKSC